MSAADTMAIWCRRCRSVCEYGCDCPGGTPQWPLVTRAELIPRIYFAHPVSDYGGPRQAAALAMLEAAGYTVENPDQPHHQVGYKLGGMDYFMRVVDGCAALAFMRFPDGTIGAGVGKEILAAQMAGIPVYDISGGSLVPDETPRPVLSIEATRATLTSIRANAE